jgi:uncharacterized protein
VVKSGDVVKVRVVEVDEARKRISLTMRLEDKPEARGPRRDQPERGERGQRGEQPRQGGGQRQGQQPRQGGQRSGGGQRGGQGSGGGASVNNSAMADALRRAGLTKD